MRSFSRQTCARLFAGFGVFSVVGVVGSLPFHGPTQEASCTLQTSSVKPALAGKFDTVLLSQSRQPQGEARVLARLGVAGGSLTPEQRNEIARLGGTIYRQLPFVQHVAIRLPAQNLARLASLPYIAHLSSDSFVRKSDEFITRATGAEAAYTQYALTGSGIGVAVVDSGIDKRGDLKGSDSSATRIIATRDFVSSGNTEPKDECGHGTHIAGIIGGNGRKSTGADYTRTFYGVARKANLINVRVLDEKGNGSVSDVIAGLDWIVQNRTRYNIRVVNLSLGHPVAEPSTTDPLCQAVENVWKSGIVVVVAAGNYGRLATEPTIGDPNEGYGDNYGSIQSPANDPYVITVGATKPFDPTANQYDPRQRAFDKIATYSSRGPSLGELTLKPDIIAPGNRVISLRPKDGTLPQVFPGNQVYKSWYTTDGSPTARSRDYYLLSGTSMAAPVVAGAAALLLEQNPGLTPDTIKARLMLSADKWTTPSGSTDPFTYGAGYLNITQALASPVTATGYALSPKLTVNTDGTLMVVKSGNYWSNGSLWGTGITDLASLWGGALRSPTVFADNGGLWTAANKLQGDIITWGGNGDDTKTGTTNGAIITWGGGDDVRPTGTVSGDIITWGGGDPKNIPVNGEP